MNATTGVVARRRSNDEPLDDDQLAFLVTAFDQGFGLFALVGWPIEDTTIMQRALGRLLRPVPGEPTAQH